MNHKNGRWAYQLIIVLVAIIATESALAHLPFADSSNNQDSDSNIYGLNIATTALSSVGTKASGALSLEADYGLSLLTTVSNLIRPLSALPQKGGVYISNSLNSEIVTKFVKFLSINPMINQHVINSKEKIAITSEDEKFAEKFKSYDDGKIYYMNFKKVDTVMSAEGYIAEDSGYVVISLGNIKDNSKMFAVLLHEMAHAVQISTNIPRGVIYDMFNSDVTTFTTDKIYNSLNWIRAEIQAHYSTSEYIKGILAMPADMKKSVLISLGLDETKLQTEMFSEISKYTFYESQEMKLVDELARRKSVNG